MANARTVSRLLPGILALAVLAVPAMAEVRMQVDTDASKRRTCPSFDCGVVGRFFFRESVLVYETVDGWSRVSGYYSAGCNGGQSAFVDSGTSDCTKSNGIENGEFAEWIRSDFLTPPRLANFER